MKDRFIQEMRKVDRDGIDTLLDYMDAAGFFKAPCSGSHHLAKDGGLVEHSLNVLDLARKLNKAWEAEIDEETLILVTLLHDLGKMGDHGRSYYVEKILKSGKRSESTPFETNKELNYIPHEVRSVMIVERFIHLSDDEEQAILWHNGLYGAFKYDISSRETALYMILHFSDMWASRVVETEEKEGE